MKNLFLKSSSPFSRIVLFVVVVWGCQKENESLLTSAQRQEQTNIAARDNNQIVAATQDVMDVTAGAMAGQGVTNGRYSSYGKNGVPELECGPSITSSFDIDKSHPDTLIYRGTLTVDYGDGSSCKDSSSVRKGKIMDSFTLMVRFKDSITYNLTEAISFQGFHKDTVQLDGTFTSKSSSRENSVVEIENAKVTYADRTSVTWNGTLTSTFARGDSGLYKDDVRKLTGSISGTTRGGAAFTAAITKEILFLYSCSRKVPVSGTIQLTVGGVISTLDYGDGTCDKTYTITSAGTAKEYAF